MAAKNTENTAVGTDLNFAAREAYKRLRSNLLFSFADSRRSHVIGFTSSIKGEGKTTTALNTALSLAESGKKVVIVDCDMRLPQVHKILQTAQAPGLSNFLAGQTNADKLIQATALHEKLFVIAAGNIPPNPTELLSSERMSNLMKALGQTYDYVIVDLPPVGIVTDALITSDYIDGMVIVVRCNFSDKRAISDAVNQLKFHKVNIIGFVLNDAEISSKYYKKSYYKDKSGKSYYGYYGYGEQK